MKYPKFLKNGDTIGLCAPSLGITIEPYISRYNSAKRKFEELGYVIITTENVENNIKGAANSGDIRAKEFVELWKNSQVTTIYSVAGGELMIEILPYIDFEDLANYPPKFFIGYSDNTFLTFTLTTLIDVATVYSHNFPHFGITPWHQEINDAMNLIKGEKLIQNSYSYYEDINIKSEDPLAPAIYDKLIQWKSLNGDREVDIQGRIIGGCLDCLISICGTKFDNVLSFNNKYKDDGIIFFFESCDLNVFGLSRALFQLINAEWFKYCTAILIGRPLNNDTIMDLTYEDALKRHLLPLGIPIIYDADVGHVPPRLTIINGSIVKIKYKDGKGTLETILR